MAVEFMFMSYCFDVILRSKSFTLGIEYWSESSLEKGSHNFLEVHALVVFCDFENS
jgi:hypothetical protein